MNRTKIITKLLALVVLLATVSVCFMGCRKPYDTPEFVTIEPSQTAFLIPLVGDSSNQASFESEELLMEAKVATKEIQIPHRWVQTKRRSWQGEWRPTATLIVVERKPVSRSWESGDTTATSANKAIFGETADAIGIYVGMNCTAMIEEKDAAKFLYRYNNTPLETIIDTDIKKTVEDEFNKATSQYKSTELHIHKADIMDAVKTNVVTKFKDYGITITVLGIKEGFSFENPAIQEALDKKFESEQDLVIQENKNEANLAKAEAEAQAKIIAAEADAKALLIAAQAEAEANEKLAASIDDKILEKMYYDKWNGQLPTVTGNDGDYILDIFK